MMPWLQYSEQKRPLPATKHHMERLRRHVSPFRCTIRPIPVFLQPHRLIGGVLVYHSVPATAAPPNTVDTQAGLLLLLCLLLALIISLLLYHRHHLKTLRTATYTQDALEKNYSLLETVFTHSPIGMMVQDQARRIIRSNAALEAILGIRPEVLDGMGTPLSSLITDETARQSLLRAYYDLLTHPGHLLKVKLPIRSINGQEKWVVVSAQTLLENNEVKGIFWQVEDITREENALRELQRVSSLDPLTGTLNRRAFMQLWRRERGRALRNKTPLSLIIIDLDHFKQINDRYGHHFGDEVLRHTAKIMQHHTRDTDMLARFGGEEFVLLLPDTDLQAALEVAEKLRTILEQYTIKPDTQQSITITFSAGLAQWQPEESFDGLYKKADTALYRAKQAGRNRVKVYATPAA